MDRSPQFWTNAEEMGRNARPLILYLRPNLKLLYIKLIKKKQTTDPVHRQEKNKKVKTTQRNFQSDIQVSNILQIYMFSNDNRVCAVLNFDLTAHPKNSFTNMYV